jgi:hypothetical protein
MTLEIQVLAWDMHETYGGVKPVNGLPTLFSLDNWISYINTYIIKRLKMPAQLRFHLTRPHDITKMNDNINIHSTIAKINECS